MDSVSRQVSGDEFAVAACRTLDHVSPWNYYQVRLDALVECK